MHAQHRDARSQPLLWVVDRDAIARNALYTLLEQQAFRVRTFATIANLEQRLARERPDLLLLERQLDAEDGLEFCRRIRNSGDDVAIIVLTALNEAEDRILGFEIGVDDYVGKPFVERELLVRIQAVLRRRRAVPAGAPLADAGRITFGGCCLDFATRLLFRDEQKITLTSGEFALLVALVRNPQRPLTRERLVELARGAGSEASERSVDVQISRLRKIIEFDSSKPRHIQTVWGYGYVFVPNL